MPSIRAIRNKVRRDLHEKAKVPAYYISALKGVEPRLVTVRLFTKYDQTGALRNDKEWMEKREVQPRIIVYNDQISDPRKGTIFSFAEGEAYRVDSTDPVDGETRICLCTVVPKAETAALPYPVDLTARPPMSPNTGQASATMARLTIPITQPLEYWELQHNLGYYPQAILNDIDGDEFIATVRHIDKNRMIVGPLNPPMPGTAILI